MAPRGQELFCSLPVPRAKLTAAPTEESEKASSRHRWRPRPTGTHVSSKVPRCPPPSQPPQPPMSSTSLSSTLIPATPQKQGEWGLTHSQDHGESGSPACTSLPPSTPHLRPHTQHVQLPQPGTLGQEPTALPSCSSPTARIKGTPPAVRSPARCKSPGRISLGSTGLVVRGRIQAQLCRETGKAGVPHQKPDTGLRVVSRPPHSSFPTLERSLFSSHAPEEETGSQQ